ncbi:hypothetical protein L6R52_19915 [Myxococcota bacterium]|nr:hypothetical protein [Myxococcota bacterium]
MRTRDDGRRAGERRGIDPARGFAFASALAAALGLGACARESSEVIAQELARLDADAAAGVAKIHRALHDPALTSGELGEGVHEVELAARGFAALELDPRASDVQQLQAVLHQARAWDDVATTFASTPAPPGLEDAHDVLLEVLAEKAEPARANAAASYRRALELACKGGLEHVPAFGEIVDGTARYAPEQVSLDRPCAEQ